MQQFDLMNLIQTIALALPGFLLAISCHEASHALVAHFYGDDTAKMQGRLTLNPAVHYDLVGTIIFPLFGIIIGGVPFGWAKPVPVDPRRFRKMKSGLFWVSFAGPAANLILFIISIFLYVALQRFLPTNFYLREPLVQMAQYSSYINIILAMFNLIPFPPLDGSRMLAPFLSYEAGRNFEELQRYSFVFILILWMTPIFSWMMAPALYVAALLEGVFRWMLA